MSAMSSLDSDPRRIFMSFEGSMLTDTPEEQRVGWSPFNAVNGQVLHNVLTDLVRAHQCLCS
jgi:hypothetical protein